MELTEQFEDALQVAFAYHRSQTRKGGDGTPYIGHLLGVAAIVIDAGGSEEQIIAALLHDAAEDQGGEATLQEIRQRFGDQVAQMVDDLSDTFEDPKPPWLARKLSYLKHLETVSDSTLMVSLADKLYNTRSIILDRDQVGEKVWSRFAGSKEECLAYYHSLGEVYCRRLGKTPLVMEYQRTIKDLQGDLAGKMLEETAGLE